MLQVRHRHQVSVEWCALWHVVGDACVVDRGLLPECSKYATVTK